MSFYFFQTSVIVLFIKWLKINAEEGFTFWKIIFILGIFSIERNI